MNREEFEKLPAIKEKVKFLLFLDGEYECISYDYINLENFVNGAWYAWQEQQKKMTQAYITLGEALNNTPDNYEDAIREAMDDLK